MDKKNIFKHTVTACREKKIIKTFAVDDEDEKKSTTKNCPTKLFVSSNEKRDQKQKKNPPSMQ